MKTEYSRNDLVKCYYDNTAAKEITFLMDFALWNVSENLQDVFVHGSFNSWQDVEKFQMKADLENKCYYATVSYDDIKSLGNSGHPEYKFHSSTGGEEDGYFPAKDRSFIPEPYCFHTSDHNLILIFEGEDIEDIKNCSKTASQFRTLSDWNLGIDWELCDNLQFTKSATCNNGNNFQFTKEGECLAASLQLTKETPANITPKYYMFANSRLVPGTTCVYRSWHPFKVKTHFKENKEYLLASEPKRVKMSNFVYEKRGIKTDICLCGDETTKLDTFTMEDGSLYTETLPEYYSKLVKEKNVLNVMYTPTGTDKSLCPEYHFIYGSKYNEEYLVGWFKNIVDFVKEDHPAPYNVHCRLGNDRTGYYCGIIASLCGATWEQIAADYQSSNNTYLGEYRDQRLLKMVFEKQFKVSDISKVQNLKNLLMEYYENNPYIKIPKEDIELLVEKFRK